MRSLGQDNNVVAAILNFRKARSDTAIVGEKRVLSGCIALTKRPYFAFMTRKCSNFKICRPYRHSERVVGHVKAGRNV